MIPPLAESLRHALVTPLVCFVVQSAPEAYGLVRNDRRQIDQSTPRGRRGLLGAIVIALVLLWLGTAGATLLESIWLLAGAFGVALIVVGVAWWRRTGS